MSSDTSKLSEPLDRVPSKHSALLDRRLITEMTVLLSQQSKFLSSNPHLSSLLYYSLTLYQELLIEKTHSSMMQSLINNTNRELGDALLFVHSPRSEVSEDFRFALTEAAEQWAEDPKFQMVVGRYERRKGGGVAAAADAIAYVQHVLFLSCAFDAAIIPHPERWPVFRYVMENCLWSTSPKFLFSELNLPINPLDGILTLPRKRRDRAAIVPEHFGVPTLQPMVLVHYEPMGHPFPRSLLRYYAEEDLVEFGTSSYEFLIALPGADPHPESAVFVADSPLSNSSDVKQISATVQQASPHKNFNVFISHNSKDKSHVLRLGEDLKRRGLTVWLDEWELIPGRTWQDALEIIITRCKSAVVCVGGDGIGPWEEPEMRALLRRFVDEKKSGNVVPIIPVLLPGARDDIKLPLFLEAFTWVDLRDGLRREGLDRLQWGITGIKPNP